MKSLPINPYGDVLSDELHAPVVPKERNTPYMQKLHEKLLPVPILTYLSFCDGPATLGEVYAALKNRFRLTDREQTETTRSGSNRHKKMLQRTLERFRTAGAIQGDDTFGWTLTNDGFRFLDFFRVQMHEGPDDDCVANLKNWFPKHLLVVERTEEQRKMQKNQQEAYRSVKAVMGVSTVDNNTDDIHVSSAGKLRLDSLLLG